MIIIIRPHQLQVIEAFVKGHHDSCVWHNNCLLAMARASAMPAFQPSLTSFLESLAPPYIMALTATATNSVRWSVTRTLGMDKLACIISHANLVYNVGKYTTVVETFKPLLKRIRNYREKCPSTIVYCQSYNMCADINTLRFQPVACCYCHSRKPSLAILLKARV